MIHLGIDCGLHGAIAALDEAGDILWITDMPLDADGVDGPVLRDLLTITDGDGAIDCRVTVEQQFAFKRVQGRQVSAVGAFSKGVGYGVVLGVVAGLGLTHSTVHPRTWQAKMTKGMPGTVKERSMKLAELRYPGAELRGPLGGAKDGRSDSLHIAEYGRLTYKAGVKT